MERTAAHPRSPAPVGRKNRAAAAAFSGGFGARWSARSCAKARGRRGSGVAIPEEKWWKEGSESCSPWEKDRGGGGGRRPGGGAAPHGELRRKRKDGGEGRPAWRGEKLKDAATYRAAAAAFGQPLSGPAGDLFPVRACPDSAAPLGPSRRGTRRPGTAKRTPHVSDLHIQKPLKTNPASKKNS
jgi:hypothetical protein